MDKKFFPLWKDKEMIILISHKFDKRNFDNHITFIRGSLYGIPTDAEILKNWGILKDEQNANR